MDNAEVAVLFQELTTPTSPTPAGGEPASTFAVRHAASAR
jgi:hypothetical protein